MAIRKTASKTAAKKPTARKATVRTFKSTAKGDAKSTKHAAKSTVAHRVVLAGLGAVERAQDSAKKLYGAIAKNTGRFTDMTTGAAQLLGEKAGVFVKEGQKIQSNVQAAAESKARELAAEVKAFAEKSQKSFRQNLKGGISATNASAMEGITRLEQVFEARVARTLNTFGIPSAQNVRELQSRMNELQKALHQLNKRGVRA